MQNGSLKPWKNRRGRNVWRLQYRVDGKGRTKILGYVAEMSRAEAEAERRRILGSPAVQKIDGGVTIQAYIDREYLTTKSINWKASTRATTEQIIQTHVVEHFGKRRIGSVTRRNCSSTCRAWRTGVYLTPSWITRSGNSQPYTRWRLAMAP